MEHLFKKTANIVDFQHSTSVSSLQIQKDEGNYSKNKEVPKTRKEMPMKQI